MNCLKNITKTTVFILLITLLVPSAVYAASLIQNGNFDTNLSNWNFFSDTPNLNTASVTNGKAVVTLNNASTTNTQLNQPGFTLKPNTLYTIKYTVSSSRNQTPFSVSVFKNTPPNTNYGYSKVITATTSAQDYSDTFTTTGFTGETTDTRLMFYFVNGGLQTGDTITIDNVSIEEGDTTGNGGGFDKYDFNEDGSVDLGDLVEIIKYVFGG